MNLRLLLIYTALTATFFPVLSWYWHRLGDGSGESFGLIPLTLAVTLSLRNRHRSSPRLAEFSLVIYALSSLFLPPLLRSVPALCTLAFLSGIHRQAGQIGLLFLSLPLQASLDFFLAYPFRIITAEGAQLILKLIGYPVQRLGVQLSHGSHIVSVDPPCSGLQMLWATALLTAILAALFHLNYRRTLQLSFIALALCLLANTLRATFLFFPESGLIELPEFLHEGIGLLFFSLAGLTLCYLARLFQHPISVQPLRTQKLSSTRFLSLACAASLINFIPARSETSLSSASIPSPLTYQDRPLEEIPLSPREASFAHNFPGQLKVYRVGHDTLITRHITRASRMLHPSYHCLKAEGFTITHSQIEKDELGRPVLRYRATRAHEIFLVSEKIYSTHSDRQWTEVSAWYWHALFHPNSGPWKAETLMTPIHHEKTR